MKMSHDDPMKKTASMIGYKVRVREPLSRIWLGYLQFSDKIGLNNSNFDRMRILFHMSDSVILSVIPKS